VKAQIELGVRKNELDAEYRAGQDRAEQAAEAARDRARGLAEHRDRIEERGLRPNYNRVPAGQLSEAVEEAGRIGAMAAKDAAEAYITNAVGGVIMKAGGPVFVALIKRGGVPLSIGSGRYALYFEYVSDDVRYIGITNDFERRGIEHLRRSGRNIQPIVMGLEFEEARGAEQLLIENYRLSGYEKDPGSLSNLIGSIAADNPKYQRLIGLGCEVLRKIHWPKPFP